MNKQQLWQRRNYCKYAASGMAVRLQKLLIAGEEVNAFSLREQMQLATAHKFLAELVQNWDAESSTIQQVLKKCS